MTTIGRPLRRNGLSGLNGLRPAADADFYAPLAVIPFLLSKAVRCGASQKKTPRDSTKTYSPRGLAFWDVPQIAAFHNKLYPIVCIRTEALIRAIARMRLISTSLSA